VSDSCPQCGGLGLLKGERGSYPCPCQQEASRKARVKRIGIPEAFADCTLENYIAGPHSYHALMTSKRYVEEFIPGKTRLGLLFTGTVGVGKTHLAVGIVRKLAEIKGVETLMVDMRKMFDSLRVSYDRRDEHSQESHGQILRPIFKNDLILMDELGAAKPSDWVTEIIEYVIGTAYNRALPMIATTNLPNAAAGGIDENQYARTTRPTTLGDRIGARMWSRLQQMCKVVQIIGPDWRRNERLGI
jgi:DNA replication protein DnaC